MKALALLRVHALSAFEMTKQPTLGPLQLCSGQSVDQLIFMHIILRSRAIIVYEGV